MPRLPDELKLAPSHDLGGEPTDEDVPEPVLDDYDEDPEPPADDEEIEDVAIPEDEDDDAEAQIEEARNG